MSSSSSRPESRVEGGVALVALGAVLLFVSLFLNWYEPGRSAWSVFEVWDLVLAVLSVVALTGVAGRLQLARPRPDSWLVGPAAASLVIILVSLVNHPPAATNASPMIGIWLALIASLMMVAGVALSVAQISVAINVHGHERLGASPAAPTGAGTAPERGRRFRRPHTAPAAPASPARPAGQDPATPDPGVGPEDAPTQATRVLGDDPSKPPEPPAPAP